MKEDIVINGKYYPMWQQFVHRKDEWVGGTLIDYGDMFDRHYYKDGTYPMKTKIIDIQLKPNEPDSAFFEVRGEDFTCGGDVKYIGLMPTKAKAGGIFINGFQNHEWEIVKNED